MEDELTPTQGGRAGVERGGLAGSQVGDLLGLVFATTHGIGHQSRMIAGCDRSAVSRTLWLTHDRAATGSSEQAEAPEVRMKIGMIVLAGGVGKRIGRPFPKQFLLLGGKPLIVHVLETARVITDID